MRQVFFIVFYAIYWIAKFYYGKEAFGRGDYWLAMALGSFIHLETLPHFFIISLSSWNMFFAYS